MSKTNRVRLDDIKEDDILTLKQWSRDGIESHTCRPIVPKSDEETMQRFRDRKNDDTRLEFAVRRIADEQLIGKVAYFDLNSRNRSVEVGYLLGPEFRGQGFAYEAMSLLLKILFVDLKLNKVYAQTGEFNAASTSLLERLGFKLDGRLRQHHELDGILRDDLLFSLLAEEYRP